MGKGTLVSYCINLFGTGVMGDSEAGMDNVPLVDKEASSAVAGATAWDRLLLSVGRGDNPESSLSQGVYVGEALPPVPLKLTSSGSS